MINFKYVKSDVFGGLTAGIVALPLALAFGVQSGMGAIYGLYGAIMLGMFAAIFGGTETQVSGPTGPMTVVSAMVIASAINLSGSIESGMGIIIFSFLLSGIFQIVFGLLKIGKYIKYIPYPVLSGFMSGIGMIIIFFQLYPFMGHVSEKNTLDIILHIGTPLSMINGAALSLATLTVLIIYLFPKVSKTIPSILVALIVVTALSFYLKLDVPLIGFIPSGLPGLKIQEILNVSPQYAWIIIEFGITLAALGAIDSLLTAVIADNITKTKHDSNRELIGQGIGNILSSFIGGLPGAGATLRTVVNIKAGGKTRLSGFFHGLLLLGILLGLSKYAAYIPLSVLAGILITVGIGIIDYKGLNHLSRVPRADAIILLIVLFITLFGNLLHAVAVGMVLACVLFMKQSSDLAESSTQVHVLKGFDTEEPWSDEGSIYEEYKGKIYIKHIYGPLFFGFTSRFQEIIKNLDSNVKVLVIRLDKVPHIDQSGIYALEDSIFHLKQINVMVLLTGVNPQPLDMLKKIKIIPNLIKDKHVFKEFSMCEAWLKSHLTTNNDAFNAMRKED